MVIGAMLGEELWYGRARRLGHADQCLVGMTPIASNSSIASAKSLSLPVRVSGRECEAGIRNPWSRSIAMRKRSLCRNTALNVDSHNLVGQSPNGLICASKINRGSNLPRQSMRSSLYSFAISETAPR